MADSLPKLKVTSPHHTTSAPFPSPKFHTLSADEAFKENLVRPRRSGDRAPSRTSTSSPTKSLTNTPFPDTEDAQDGAPPAIDPLSQHILKRTKTGTPIAEKLRSTTHDSTSRPGTPADGTPEIKKSVESPRVDSFGTNKDKKKGVSFLSRFIGGNKKKSGAESVGDKDSELGDAERLEGKEAEIFSQPIENLGFLPKHPQPPAYIKVRARCKKEKEFDRVFLAQELCSRATKKKQSMGPNGSQTSRRETDDNGSGNPTWAMEFSRDGKYLAAGGQDRILRIWATLSSAEERRFHEKEEAAAGQAQHLSAPVFQKKAVQEYEGHTSTILDLSWSKNNFLLSSSMDKTVRLWHVSRPECLCTFKHADFVPSIQFHPRDDRFFLAGSLDTKLRLWSIPDKNVAYWAQLPDMITAVSFTPDGKTAIAGTLNGLCQFYETEGLKYQTQMHVKSAHGKNAKGSKITGIQAVCVPADSNSGEVKILVTSNDSRIRLYNLRDKNLEAKYKGHENNQSQIRASFSPDASYVITGSEDRKAYIFSTTASESEKRNQHAVEMFEAHTSISTCAIMAPTSTRQLLSRSEDPVYDICNPPPVTLVSKAESFVSSQAPTEAEQSATAAGGSKFKRAEESPAYIARSVHNDGNIMVTADYSGSIKVFRQDCAYQKRRNDAWETSSTFSKKMGGRTMSIQSKRSGRRDSTSTQPPQERIMSWRQEIQPSGSADSLALRNGGTHSKNRSVSPRKSPAGSSLASGKKKGGNSDQKESSVFDSEVNPMWVKDKQSYAFWNTQTVREQMERAHDNRLRPEVGSGRPALSQQASTVSALSYEEASTEEAESGSRGPEPEPEAADC
ncbi:WD40 repeat-like protein [Pseudovirgaria hyperparasitica]|uniref:WD40 repeat-like protein n=1 Tax=Pseudovirgaria hyperparasitica TaxID=470096 RepID=A0A6A6WL31_9PEZI|nr:WD40 repeat-like protein [Pseudovirgaria hyperparasitica]KAF2762873.1 WD40 repeat-like protein [Pseudovirgaria hyperparasitica]